MVYYSLPTWADTLLDRILPVVFDLTLLPPLWLYYQIRWRIRPPPASWAWSRSQYMWVNIVRTRGAFVKAYRVMPLDLYENAVCAPSKTFCDRLQCKVTVVTCPQLDPVVPRLGPLTVATDVVSDMPRGGFFIVPQHSNPEKSLPPARSAARGEKIFYYIVGGGYAGGHPLTLHTPYSLANISNHRVFAISYRKSVSDAGAFPGSLIDCLVGYQYLIKQLGFEPRNVILSGDSAGGNACLALARYLGDLEDHGYTDLGQVGGMYINSPWCDMTASFPSYKSNCYFDALGDLVPVFIPAHTRHFPGQRANPYFSPALTPEGGFRHLARHGVKISVSTGTAEKFDDEIRALHAGLLRDGVDSKLRTVLGGIHSEFVFLGVDSPNGLGWSWSVLAADAKSIWEAVGGGGKKQ